MKLSHNGGKLVAPELPVGEEVFVDRIKFCILPILYSSLQFLFQFCGKYPPLLSFLRVVVSVTCISSFLVRL